MIVGENNNNINIRADFDRKVYEIYAKECGATIKLPEIKNLERMSKLLKKTMKAHRKAVNVLYEKITHGVKL